MNKAKAAFQYQNVRGISAWVFLLIDWSRCGAYSFLPSLAFSAVQSALHWYMSYPVKKCSFFFYNVTSCSCTCVCIIWGIWVSRPDMGVQWLAMLPHSKKFWLPCSRCSSFLPHTKDWVRGTKVDWWECHCRDFDISQKRSYHNDDDDDGRWEVKEQFILTGTWMCKFQVNAFVWHSGFLFRGWAFVFGEMCEMFILQLQTNGEKVKFIYGQGQI